MDGRFDELLLGLAQKHEGIDALWYTLMSFYERRTDLFHVKETVDDKKGFKPGEAEDMFRRQFAHFQARYLERAQPHLLAHNRQALESAVVASRDSGTSAEAGGYPGAVAVASTAAGPAPAPTPSASSTAQPAPIPYGVNASPLEGGDPGLWERNQERSSDNIQWNQTPSEVNIEVTIEKSTKHDIKVNIESRRICVKSKGTALLEGRLKDKVNTEESTWHLSDGKVIVLSLEKIKPMFWEALFETPAARAPTDK